MNTLLALLTNPITLACFFVACVDAADVERMKAAHRAVQKARSELDAALAALAALAAKP